MVRKPKMIGNVLNRTIFFLLVLAFLSSFNAWAQSGGTPFVVDPAFQSKIGLQDPSSLTGKAPRKNAKAVNSKTDPSNASQPTLLSKDQIEKIKHRTSGGGPLNGVVTDAQRQNLMQLTAGVSDKKTFSVVFNRANGTPDFIRMKSLLKSAARKEKPLLSLMETKARQFLAANRQLLKLMDPDKELSLATSWTDSLGAGHFKYRQMVGGIPVFGKQVLVHVDSSDSVYLFNGQYEPSPPALPATPLISEAEAVTAVGKHLNLPDIATESIELVMFTKPDGKMLLTYKIEVAPSISEKWVYFIDAASAHYVHRLTRIRREVVSARGMDLNSAEQSFTAWHDNGDYYLIDPTMPLPQRNADYVSTIQSPGNTYVISADYGYGEALQPIISSSPVRGWDPAGVSAMAHIGKIHTYYKETFNRNGLDNHGMNYMVVLHYGRHENTAGWNGEMVLFGDGDNRLFRDTPASLDAIAHELQHGVTQYSAGLVYENQSGSLDEAYSDLFGCMVDDSNWTTGEGITVASPGYLRNLADPTKGLDSMPAKMSEYVNRPNTEEGDSGGVHTNMSIPAHAGYLMAEGLENSIGRAKTARIWYRALTVYLTAYAQFSDARKAMVQSADDLYGPGSPERAAVQAAWDKVEVFEENCATTPPIPTSGDPVSGNDIMIFLYPMDDSHDRPYDANEHYYLYVLRNSDGNFEAVGPLNSAATFADLPLYARPAAYTNSAGQTTILYVTEDHDLHRVLFNTDGTYAESEEISDAKSFYSIAVSADGRYLAYTTTSADDNHIYIVDFENTQTREFAIAAPEYNAPSGNLDNVAIHAENLAFDYTGKTLAFDVLNCLSTPGNSCRNGQGHYYTTIGLLSLSDDPQSPGNIEGAFSFPFSNQSPDFDIINPAFAANNSYALAFDLIDYSNTPRIESILMTLNGLDGQTREVTSLSTESSDGSPSESARAQMLPSFWGDDSAVTIQRAIGNRISAFRVPIDENFAGPMTPDFQGDERISRITDYDAAMPLMHRQAARSVTGEITFSASSLSFGNVAAGTQSRQSLTLTNSSGRDIYIEDISIDGSKTFIHNGTHRLLPRDGRITMSVMYAPKSAGSESATLTITSNADIPTHHISLTGSASGRSGNIGSSGGCMISALTASSPNRTIVTILLLMISALIVLGGVGWSVRREGEKSDSFFHNSARK